MPFDRSSPLHRFRVDPRTVRRDQIERLEALGVALVEISPSRARPLFARFVREFLDPLHAAALSAELARPRAAQRALDLDRWLRPECVRREVTGCIGWLLAGAPKGAGQEGARGVRFERRPDLPALAIDLTTLKDDWAASWPGVFVSFEAGRAVVVTLDYEQIRCDVRTTGATPYR